MVDKAVIDARVVFMGMLAAITTVQPLNRQNKKQTLTNI